jgi:small subunit ribosomal protein S6
MLNSYETVVVLTPVLSDEQAKELITKFRAVLTENGAEIVHEDNWGLRKLAYPIDKKSTGYYHITEFKAPGELVAKLELEYKRDERVMRFLTIALDKFAMDYNDRKRKGLIGIVKSNSVKKVKVVLEEEEED